MPVVDLESRFSPPIYLLPQVPEERDESDKMPHSRKWQEDDSEKARRRQVTELLVTLCPGFRVPDCADDHCVGIKLQELWDQLRAGGHR